MLPKYDITDLLLVSVSSNNTFERQIAQNYTFGRIFDLQFVTDSDFPSCVLCMEEDVDDACHCPEFRKPCSPHIFHQRPLGWWCATRKALAAVEVRSFGDQTVQLSLGGVDSYEEMEGIYTAQMDAPIR